MSSSSGRHFSLHLSSQWPPAPLLAASGHRVAQKVRHFDGHLASSMRKCVTNVLLGTMTILAIRHPSADARTQNGIVLKRTLVTNFLMELVKWPSKWHTFWATRCPEVASSGAGGHWEERCKETWRPDGKVELRSAHIFARM